METTRQAPADTRSMGIVHSALRRDLERTRIVLTDQPHPDGDRRRAISSHLLWMMSFLHMHHTGEDIALWPLVRAKNPAAGPLLDQMDLDHQRIAPAITAVEVAARAYRDDGSARDALLTAVTELTDVLLPHLRREELEMMPVVSATLTDDEYRALEHEQFVAPKGIRELGAEAHWVLDGLPQDGRDVMLHVVPAVPRFILLHAFARGYRRRSALRWGDGPAATLPSQQLSTAQGAP
jgi:hypothetical protein